jgi:hypothetical protein
MHEGFPADAFNIDTMRRHPVFETVQDSGFAH